MKSRTLTLIANEARGLFNAAAEPTLEGLAGKDSFNRSLAAGDQAADLLDGDRDARLTVNTNGVATVFHLDAALDRRLRVDRVILDGHTLRKAYGDDVGNLVKVLYNSTDNYGTATEAAIARVQSRLLARGPAYMEFDGRDDKVTVADDANLDFGYGDGAIEFIVKFTDISTDAFLFGRRGGSGEVFYGLWDQANSRLDFNFYTGGTVKAQARVSWVPNQDQWYHIVWVIDNGDANAVYIDGISQTLAAEDHTGGDLELVADFTWGHYNNNYGAIGLGLGRLWNRAPTAAEVLTRYNGWTHTPLPTADQRGSQTTLWDGPAGDFTTGTYSWVAIGNNTIANVDYTLEITYVNHTDGAWNRLKDASDLSADLEVGQRYRIRVQSKYSGGSAGSYIFIGSGAEELAQTAMLTTNWTYYNLEFVARTTNADFIQMRGMGASNIVHIDELDIWPIGCVAEWAPDGISPTHGKWYVRNGNNLHGAITGAEARDVPSGDEGEVLLIELEQEIDARYLYMVINPGGLMADANTLFGQMLLGRAAALAGVREFDEELGYPGIDTLETYGGSELPSVRYEGERREWPLHLVAQGDTYPDGIYRAYKAAKGTKKVPLYLVEDITLNDGRPERLIHCVKFDAPLRRRRTGKYHEIETALREVGG